MKAQVEGKKVLEDLLSAEEISEINKWIAKYPKGRERSAVLSALMIVQEKYGSLTDELMNAVADYLDMPDIAVYEVATFYSMYELKPVGRHVINVCTNISCQLRKSHEVVKYLEEKLDVKLGQTTKDERFTLKEAECLGACVGAPMMQVDKDYHENLTPEKIDALLEQYQ